MRILNLFALTAAMILFGSCSQQENPTSTQPDQDPVFNGGGYNQLGYNYKAQRFKGAADGADGALDGAYFGRSSHANDNLTMKWNDEWMRGVQEQWQNPPYDAHCSYSWRGHKKHGTGTMWQYDIHWVGPALQDSPRWVDYGFPIWEIFEVQFRGRTVATVDFWETQALSADIVCPL